MDTMTPCVKIESESMDTEPRVCVIVVCRNPGAGIATTLESIWKQDSEVEVVVVDGASSDGTVNWLRSHSDRIDHIITEPDAGIYDAMNKGVRKARGDWALFLGAGDLLSTSATISRIRPHLTADRDIVCGLVEYTDCRRWVPSVHPIVQYRNFLHHQGTFYRRTRLLEYPFDQTLKIQADYELNLRLWSKGLRSTYTNISISLCLPGGISDRALWQNYREEIQVRHRYFPGCKSWLWDGCSVARFVRKKILRR